MKIYRNLIIIKVFLQFALVFCNDEMDDSVSSKYITNDGIKVLREDFENFLKKEQIEDKDIKKGNFGGDRLFEREYKLEQEESKEYSQKLPRRCHVCKIFVEEFTDILEKNSTKKNGYFVFKPSLFYKALHESCDNMKQYAVTRTSAFRYKKGDSVLRQIFDEAQKGSKIKTWSYTLPRQQIDDPTGEIQRLTEKCQKLMKYHGGKSLLDWIQNHSKEPLDGWFCDEIYLKNNKKGCLAKTIQKDKKWLRDEL